MRRTKTELRDEIKDAIKAINDESKSSKLATFDVRKYVFERIAEDRNKKAQEDEWKEEWQKDWNNWIKFKDDKAHVIVKTAIGKKWMKKKNGKLVFDYDASYFSTYIYWKTVFSGDKTYSIKRNRGYTYELSPVKGSDKTICYRGDTMNSWSTTLDHFCRCFGGEYLEGLKEYKGTWRTPKGEEWYEFLSEPGNYNNNPFPSYITDFMDVVYKIGNFMPVPCGFYSRGNYNLESKDYWDLALLAIYDYYHGNNFVALPFSLRWLVGDVERARQCQMWLNRFAGWDDFVERNYLQPFVSDPEEGHYGKPLELWDGHFEGEVMPQKGDTKDPEKQFREFFERATERIKERGQKIADAYKKRMQEET